MVVSKLGVLVRFPESRPGGRARAGAPPGGPISSLFCNRSEVGLCTRWADIAASTDQQTLPGQLRVER
eukprot:4390912-Alexandrium_andersonii.AAC.1